jgi:hypothetical protein
VGSSMDAKYNAHPTPRRRLCTSTRRVGMQVARVADKYSKQAGLVLSANTLRPRYFGRPRHPPPSAGGARLPYGGAPAVSTCYAIRPPCDTV